MIPQKISRRLRNIPRGRYPLIMALASLMIWALGIWNASCQPFPEIDSSSLRIEPGPVLTFQFQAAGQAANAYAIETASEFASNGSWNQATQAVIAAVADGLFRVTLAVQSDRLFCSTWF